MADLTQNVKYIVSVDTAALDLLRDKLQSVVTTAKGLDGAFGRIREATQAAMGGAASAATSATAAMGTYEKAANSAAKNEETRLRKLERERAKAAQAQQVALEKQARAVDRAQAAEMRAYNQGMRNLKEFTAFAKRKADERIAAAKKEEGATEGTQIRFLKLFGTFQAAKYTVTQAFNAIREGAQSLDLDRVLGTQLGNFSKMLDDVRKSTAGMVSDQGLKKSIALMTSFGIPTEGMAESLGLVQKMAIRTGQSAEFLSESFARGISRLSPLILDNLGIQVSLKEANEVYAKSIGKTTDQLTKAEQTTALMNETLRLLKKNTEGIDLEASAGATVARASALWDNAVNKIKEGAATGFVAWEQVFAGVGTNAKFVTSQLNQLATEAKNNKDAPKGLADNFKNLATVLDGISESEGLVRLFGVGEEGFFGATTPKGILATAQMLARDYAPTLDMIVGALNDYNQSWLVTAERAEAARQVIDRVGLAELARMNFMSADSAAAKQLEIYKAQLAAQGVILSKTDEERKLAELVALNRKNIVLAMDAAQKKHAGNNQALGQYLVMLLKTEDAFKGITANLNVQSWLFAKAVTSEREAMALMDARLKGHEEDLAFQVRRNAMLDGQILSEIELGEVKAKLAAAEEKVNEALARYKEAQSATDKKAILEELDGLRQKATAASQGYRAAYAFNADQLAYIDKFKNATKSVVAAEVVKLEAQAGQLRLQAAQLEIMLRMLAAGKDINTEQVKAFKLQADNAEAMAKRLGSGKDGRGGGSGAGTSDRDTGMSPLSQWLIQRAKDANERRKFHEDFNKHLDTLRDIGNRAAELVPSTNGRGDFFGLSTFTGVDEGDFQAKRDAIKEILKLQEAYLAAGGNKDGFAELVGVSEEDLARTDAYLQSYSDHLQRMKDIGDSAQDIATVLDSFAAGMDGLFGKNYVGMINDLAGAFGKLADAMHENKGAYKQVAAALPILRAFSANLIKDMKTRAWFEMAMQAAAAWAAFASYNYPKGVMHAAAATTYGLVAGGVLRLPKGKAKTDTAGTSKEAGATKRADVHIYISGPIATTEAERGAMIRDAIRAADREGM